MRPEQPQPRGTLKRSLTWRVSALVATALGASLFAYQTMSVGPYVEAQSATNLAAASGMVRSRLSLLFEQVERDLDLAKARGTHNRFTIDDVDGFNAWFIPYLTHMEPVTSVLLASEDGREILLLQLRDGTWMNRVSDPAVQPGTIRRILRADRGRVIEDVEKASNYDARKRPWFRGAMALPSDDGLHWTSPYIFFTTREPGITASMRWTAKDGKRYVLAFDVLLRDLATAVRETTVSPNGFAALIANDGRIIAPPRLRGAPPEPAEELLLQPARTLGVAPLTAALAAAGSSTRDPSGANDLSVEVDDDRWFARLDRYALGTQGIDILTMAPEVDFAPSSRRLLSALALISTIVVLVGVWAAARLAARVAQPLELLAAESERIGALDFSHRADVASPWREIERLATAQGQMRSLLRDATRRLENARRDLELRVEERTTDLRAANAELASFGYAVSDDLRAPLRLINGYCSVILDGEGASGLAPDSRVLLERAREATVRMDQLIDGLLAVARLSTRPLQREVVDLSALALDVTEELRHSDPTREVRVAIQPGCRTYGDPALLRDVMANLLGNAWKYTRDTPQAEIVFDKVEEDGERIFRVRDNGAGFDMGRAARLFLPFQRLHSEHEFAGTGIGLTTVRRILELHGGRVWAESEPGSGATFFFTVARRRRGRGETDRDTESEGPAAVDLDNHFQNRH